MTFNKIPTEITEAIITKHDNIYYFNSENNHNVIRKANLLRYQDKNIVFLNIFARNGTGKSRLTNFATYNVGNYPIEDILPINFQNSISLYSSSPTVQHLNNVINLNKLFQPNRLIYTNNYFLEIENNDLMYFLKINPILTNINFKEPIPQELINSEDIYTNFFISPQHIDQVHHINFNNKTEHFLYTLLIVSSFFQLNINAFLSQMLSINKQQQLLTKLNNRTTTNNIIKFIKKFINLFSTSNQINITKSDINDIRKNLYKLRSDKAFKTLKRSLYLLNNKIKQAYPQNIINNNFILKRSYNSFFNIYFYSYEFKKNSSKLNGINFCAFGSQGEKLLLSLLKLELAIKTNSFNINQTPHINQNNPDNWENKNNELFIFIDDLFTDFDRQNLSFGIITLFEQLEKLQHQINKTIYIFNLTHDFGTLKIISRQIINSPHYRPFICLKNLILNSVNIKNNNFELSYNEINQPNKNKDFLIMDKINTHIYKNFNEYFLMDFILTNTICREHADVLQKSQQIKKANPNFLHELNIYISSLNPIFHLCDDYIIQLNLLLTSFTEYQFSFSKNFLQLAYSPDTRFQEYILVNALFCHVFNTIKNEKILSPHDHRFLIFKFIVFRKTIETTFLFECSKEKNIDNKTLLSDHKYMTEIKKTQSYNNSLIKYNFNSKYIDKFINEVMHSNIDLSNYFSLQENEEDEKNICELIDHYAEIYKQHPLLLI